MKKQRAIIQVTIDLDPIPGAYHQPQDWVNLISEHLRGARHYNPRVELLDVIDPNRVPFDIRDNTNETLLGE